MANQKTIRIQYYALLREQRGQQHETLATEAETAADLYRELSTRHGFSLQAKQLAVAINDSFSSWEERLADNDLIVFLPPVAGG